MSKKTVSVHRASSDTWEDIKTARTRDVLQFDFKVSEDEGGVLYIPFDTAPYGWYHAVFTLVKPELEPCPCPCCGMRWG